jgi:hypothetical protein
LHRLDSSGSGQGQVEGSCECNILPPGSIKCGEFLDLLRNSQILKKDSASLISLAVFLYFCVTYDSQRGTAVAQWLRFCATNRKVAGSIPDGVMEFFL